MSQWWLLIAAFWFWYLVDSVKPGRRLRFVLTRALGRGPTAASHGTVAVTSVSPLGWHVRTEDPPVAFSPEGLSNVPVGSAGRPAPMPVHAKAWRWEEIRQLSAKRGRIFINGEYFCAVTPFTTAKRLRDLIDGCKNREPKARAAWLEARIAEGFRVARLRRQRNVLLGRTGSLAIWAGFGLGLALVVSAYLLLGGVLPVSEMLAGKIGRVLPLLGLYLAGLHMCLVIAGWIAHRRLLPKHGEARFSLLFSALLLPPQAYRLRSRIGAEYFQAAHPLAWLAAVGKQGDFILYARQALADLRWQLAPAHLETERRELYQTISSWMRKRMENEFGRLLRERKVSEGELLAPPKKDCPESCAYCPRCGSQFTVPEGRCPHGIELAKF
ncbi:MAG: hypothetical protein QM715_10705 [Nibricoccus sp.]